LDRSMGGESSRRKKKKKKKEKKNKKKKKRNKRSSQRGGLRKRKEDKRLIEPEAKRGSSSRGNKNPLRSKNRHLSSGNSKKQPGKREPNAESGGKNKKRVSESRKVANPTVKQTNCSKLQEEPTRTGDQTHTAERKLKRNLAHQRKRHEQTRDPRQNSPPLEKEIIHRGGKGDTKLRNPQIRVQKKQRGMSLLSDNPGSFSGKKIGVPKSVLTGEEDNPAPKSTRRIGDRPPEFQPAKVQ